MTRREYGLFAYLMRHRGETVSKTEILQNVWDPAFDGDPNVVEVYIRYLRLKLDAPFNRHAIETVRGLGYRINTDGG
jgi:two-component system OmpR family response regulator